MGVALRCPNCEHENREGRKFCAECAAALSLLCPSCDSKNEPGERFCGECAAPLAEASGFQTLVAQPPVASSQRDLPESFGDGRYRVQRFLGEGGVKRVYLARDTKIGSNVAVAAIKEDLGPDAVARIEREVQSMGRLRDHPHIANIHDIGGDGVSTYIVQEFMEGGSIADALRAAPENRLPMADVIRISGQICQALAFAHEQGIVHRDVKPENVWLTADGTAKLGDFGLAISVDSSRLTQAGTMLGTVAYMPPELAVGGTREADVRCDLYSLGAMMYEMAAGRPPFAGTDPVAIISQHISTAPVAPSWHNAAVPKPLEAIILKLLEKRPEDRPESAKVVGEQLRALAGSMAPGSSDGVDLADANPIDRIAGGVFVGREEETQELRSGLASAISGQGKIVLLTGEPGIGKTRMAEELATYARLRNAQVLWGRCHERAGQPSYWPWVQAIRSYVHSKDLQALASDMGSGAADIAQVVTEVRDRLPGLVTPPALEPEQARFRLFDSITTFLKNASNREPLVIVLDDIQWADEASLLLLQFLAREIQSARVLVIGTVRDTELDREQPSARVLAELTKEPVTSSIALSGITTDEITQFVELSTGQTAAPGLAEALYKQAEGNPFVTGEIVKLLASDGRLDEGASTTSWSVAIPDGVRAVVTKRLEHLSEACRDFLASAAVAGREFELRVVERASGVSVETAVDALDEATAARLVEELEEGTDRYQFSHAITRDALYQDQPASRRLELHRSVGECLESIYGTEAGSHIGQLAYHFAEAAKAGTAEKAVAYSRLAGDQALERLAYEDAVTHYRRALQSLELKDKPDEAQRCDLLLTLGEAHNNAGHVSNSKETFQRAADTARKLELPEQLARAALGYDAGFGGAVRFEVGVLDETLVDLLEEALRALGEGDSVLRAQLLARLAAAIYWSESQERRDLLSGQAIDMAQRVGDKMAFAFALNGRGWALAGPDNIEQRLADATDLVRLADDEGLRHLSIANQGHSQRLGFLLELGDLAGVDREIEYYRLLAEEMRAPWYVWYTLLVRAMRALMEGRFEEGEELAQEAFAVGQRAGNPTAVQAFGAQTMVLRRDQGRIGELEGFVKGFVEQQPDFPLWRCGLALVYCESGRESDSRREFERLAANDFDDLPRDSVWFTAVVILAETCTFLGDVDRAARLYDLLLPYAARNVTLPSGGAYFGSVSHYLGKLANIMGRWEQAEDHFDDAVEMNAKMGARPWIVRTQYEYARMLGKRGGEVDMEKAQLLIAKSLETAEEIGMAALVSDIVALKLELQGVTN